MAWYFSASTAGFYTSIIHGDAIPPDCVEITGDEHISLMRAQSAGKSIVSDAAGRPLAVDPPAASPVEQALQTLQTLDRVIPRIAEDLLEALGVNESSLPRIVQDRLAAKRAARAIVRGAGEDEKALTKP